MLKSIRHSKQKKIQAKKLQLNTNEMIIVMKRNAPDESIKHMIDYIKSVNLEPAPLYGTERTVIAVLGDERGMDMNHLKAMPDVSDVMGVLAQYKLVSRETKFETTQIALPNGTVIGANKLAIMSGPCAVESQEQVDKSADIVVKEGVTILRGGAYKPRTSPYAFQGMGIAGLKILQESAKARNMAVITEVMAPHQVEVVAEHADILQIGARNMQNFDLLKEAGQSHKPVMLKRGMSATLQEFMLAAEYIMKEGNQNVILCPRGIRTFEPAMRNTCDIDAVAWCKKESHLPVIFDPSHATGDPDLIAPMALAAIAAGADGIMVETHHCPEEAKCDGAQAMTDKTFPILMKQMKAVAEAVGREL